MSNRRSILLLDEQAETQVVLQTALATKNVDVLSAHDLDHGRRLMHERHPELIVLDLEVAPQSNIDWFHALTEDPADATPVVMLGTARRGTLTRQNDSFLAKPYDYKNLVARIETLLAQLPPAVS